MPLFLDVTNNDLNRPRQREDRTLCLDAPRLPLLSSPSSLQYVEDESPVGTALIPPRFHHGRCPQFSSCTCGSYRHGMKTPEETPYMPNLSDSTERHDNYEITPFSLRFRPSYFDFDTSRYDCCRNTPCPTANDMESDWFVDGQAFLDDSASG